MADFCKDCDRIQVKPSGTAPPRPHYKQPTKYDHFENFQKFKQAKEEEQLISQRKEELLKFNTNFTNFHLNRVLTTEEIEQLSPQDIAKLRQQLKNGSCDRIALTNTNITGQKETTELKNIKEENDDNSMQKKKSLLALTRTPVQCPISVCQRTIGVTFVLSHFLRDHSVDLGVQCQEIYKGKRSVLIFDPNNLEFRENICLGILAYGGELNESSSRPSERGLCINNAFLPKPYEHLSSHLPILIMACRTYWSASCYNNRKELEINIQNPKYISQELLVIWLASVETVKPIQSTVTLYDKAMTSSRSAVIQIRDLKDPQNPQEFILKETNFLRLSHGDINILSAQREECIHLEIMINDYE